MEIKMVNVIPLSKTNHKGTLEHSPSHVLEGYLFNYSLVYVYHFLLV